MLSGVMNCKAIIRDLKGLGSQVNVEGMGRYGINVANALGVSVTALRRIAKRIGKDHRLALQLWETGIHEARILAVLIDQPDRVTRRQANAWVRQLDSWDVCDLLCLHLLDRTPFAWDKAVMWAERKATFVRRAGFSMMACLAVHDKTASDADFRSLLPIIERHAGDERNFVRKAVSWALRQIGKRSRRLNRAAVAAAKRIRKQDTRSAKWIAADALRELTSETTLGRL